MAITSWRPSYPQGKKNRWDNKKSAQKPDQSANIVLDEIPSGSSGLWKGIYHDGLRVGIWLGYDSIVSGASKDVLKQHKFSFLAEKKIWVGPAGMAEELIKKLHEQWPDHYPKSHGNALLQVARKRKEPFWSMAVLPVLVRQPDGFVFIFPYDVQTTNMVRKSGKAKWDKERKAWLFPIEVDRQDIDRILSQSRIPRRFLQERNDFPFPVESFKASGVWTPYSVSLAVDTTEDVVVKLEVGGNTLPLLSNIDIESAKKKQQMESDKKERERQIEVALHSPMRLLSVESGVVDSIGAFAKLMEHQKDGVRHFLARTSALNADDMGLGKTRQTIAAAGYLLENSVKTNGPRRPVIIVCPASLKANWESEIKMVYPEATPFIYDDELPVVDTSVKPVILDEIALHENMDLFSDDTSAVAEKPLWWIVSYNKVSNILDKIMEQENNTGERFTFPVIAFDEAHYLKEVNSQRTKNAFDLAEKAERKWLLTATPILNRAEETWTLLRLSGHPVGDIHMKEFITMFSNSQRGRKALGDRIKEWVIRRSKKDVLTLRGKFHFEPIISVDNSETQLYNSWLGDDTLNALQRINFIMQWLERNKRGPILDMLYGLQPDAKALVFCRYTKTVDWFMEELADSAVRITGADTQVKREQSKDRFQNDPSCRWCICNIDAAGVGHNLTAASYVFFASRPWTASQMEQAEDRAYRIGQENAVEIYTPTILGTLDEKIRELIIAKKKISTDVLSVFVEK